MTPQSFPDRIRQEATLSFTAANLLSIPLQIGILGLFLLPYRLLWGPQAWSAALTPAFTLGILLPVFTIGIVAHEALHALGWRVAGNITWHDFSFGIQKLTPYAHCKVALSVTAYRIGILLPCMALGVVPGGLGLLFNNGALVFVGALFTMAASGDLMIYWLLRRVPTTALVLDHPEKVGCVVLLAP